VKRTSWSQGLSVTADGTGVVPLAGAVAVRLLADRVGLTEGLSTALARRGFVPVLIAAKSGWMWQPCWLQAGRDRRHRHPASSDSGARPGRVAADGVAELG
jgi:hypothetical protein